MNISTCIGKDNPETVNLTASQGGKLVELVNGKPATTSNVIAATFGKRHGNVIRAIKNLDCSPGFHALNFELMFVDAGIGNGATRKDPIYIITENGFSFLAMGFTGKEAAKWKEAYISAFDMMKSEILRISQSAKALTNGLAPSQQRKLQEAVSSKAMALPKALQQGAYPKLWGSLKSHFQVGTYKDLSPAQFDAALSFVESYSWELVDAPVLPVPATLKGNYHFPLSTADTCARKERKIGTAWLSPANLIDPRNRAPELEVVEQLEKDGYDVMGLKMRILALRDVAKLAEERRSEYESLSRSIAVMAEKLSVMSFHQGKCVQFVGSPDMSHPIDRHVYRDQLKTA